MSEDADAAAARYRADLRHATRPTRAPGFALAGLGVVAAVLRGTVLPDLSAILPLALIVAALGLMAIGSIRRARYHWRRMRGL